MGEKEKKSVKQKLARLKHKEIIIAIIAVVIMLLIYFSSISEKSSGKENESAKRTDYCLEIKQAVIDAVIKLSGDKNATAAIGWESSEEYVIAYTTSQNGSSVTQTPTLVQASGESKPIVLQTLYPKAIGAVVVFDGATDTRKRIEVMELVSTLLGISPEKVAVYESK